MVRIYCNGMVCGVVGPDPLFDGGTYALLHAAYTKGLPTWMSSVGTSSRGELTVGSQDRLEWPNCY